jgi:hypothetical protein
MSGIILTCDVCGHEMRVTRQTIGTRGRCAGCGAIITVGHRNTRPLVNILDAQPRKEEGVVPDTPAPNRDPFDVPEEEPTSEPEIPAFAKGHPGLFRAVLWIAGFLILAAALLMSLMPEPELTPEEMAQIKAAALKTYSEPSPIMAYRKELALGLVFLVYAVIVLYGVRAHLRFIRRESDPGIDIDDFFCLSVICPLAVALSWKANGFLLDLMGMVFRDT